MILNRRNHPSANGLKNLLDEFFLPGGIKRSQKIDCIPRRASKAPPGIFDRRILKLHQSSPSKNDCAVYEAAVDISHSAVDLDGSAHKCLPLDLL